MTNENNKEKNKAEDPRAAQAEEDIKAIRKIIAEQYPNFPEEALEFKKQHLTYNLNKLELVQSIIEDLHEIMEENGEYVIKQRQIEGTTAMEINMEFDYLSVDTLRFMCPANTQAKLANILQCVDETEMGLTTKNKVFLSLCIKDVFVPVKKEL